MRFYTFTYSAENVLIQNRDATWAEGVDGSGIGESITYRQSCTALDPNEWRTMSPERDIQVLNGGMIEVRFEIAEVYPGSVYEDTCLTGLVMEFGGRHAH